MRPWTFHRIRDRYTAETNTRKKHRRCDIVVTTAGRVPLDNVQCPGKAHFDLHTTPELNNAAASIVIHRRHRSFSIWADMLREPMSVRFPNWLIGVRDRNVRFAIFGFIYSWRAKIGRWGSGDIAIPPSGHWGVQRAARPNSWWASAGGGSSRLKQSRRRWQYLK
jgi:hypothetical protein